MTPEETPPAQHRPLPSTVSSQQVWEALGLPGRRAAPNLGCAAQVDCVDANATLNALRAVSTQIDEDVRQRRGPRDWPGPLTRQPGVPPMFTDNRTAPAVEYEAIANLLDGELDNPTADRILGCLGHREWFAAALKIERYLRCIDADADRLLRVLGQVFDADGRR